MLPFQRSGLPNWHVGEEWREGGKLSGLCLVCNVDIVELQSLLNEWLLADTPPMLKYECFLPLWSFAVIIVFAI